MLRTAVCMAALVLLLGLSACGDSGPTGSGRPTSENPELLLEAVIDAAIPDSSLRAAVLEALRALPSYPDTSTVDSLVALAASRSGICRLQGIAILRRLEILDLAANAIVDLTPLAALPSLQALDLSLNRIVDIAPLANLKALRLLVLDGNQIERIGSLVTLTALEQVSLTGNPVVVGTDVLQQLAARGVSVVAPDQADAFPDTTPNVQVMAQGPVPGLRPLTAPALRVLAVGEDGRWYGAGAEPSLVCSRDQGDTWVVLADSSLRASKVQVPDALGVTAVPAVLMLHSRTGWRRTADEGLTWQAPGGLAQSAGWSSYQPVIFDQVRWVDPAGSLGYTLTVNALDLRVTHDAGLTWRSVFPNVRAFCVRPSLGELFAYTGARLWYSPDEGSTWKAATGPTSQTIALAADPGDPSALLVATVSGLERLNWTSGATTPLLPADEGWNAARITVDERLPEAIFVVSGGRRPQGFDLSGDIPLFDALPRQLWYSRDQGQSWAEIGLAYPRDVLITGEGAVLILADDGLYRLE